MKNQNCKSLEAVHTHIHTENYYKKEKAITLIALVITIIILLILAGVTISTLSGENGLLNRAKTAQKTYSEEDAKEGLTLKINALRVQIWQEEQRNATLNDVLEKLGTDDEVKIKELIGNSTASIVSGVEKLDNITENSYMNLEYKGYEIKINYQLIIISINGVTMPVDSKEEILKKEWLGIINENTNASIEDIINDENIFTRLISNEASYLYMLTNETIVDKVLSNENAIEVLDANGKIQSVPLMTSNTTPSGKVTTTGSYGEAWDGYKAFDQQYGDPGHCWCYGYDSNAWLDYEFENEMYIYQIKLNLRYNQCPISFQYYDSSSNSYVNLIDYTEYDVNNMYTLKIDNPIKASKFRLQISEQPWTYVEILNYYGLKCE